MFARIMRHGWVKCSWFQGEVGLDRWSCLGRGANAALGTWFEMQARNPSRVRGRLATWERVRARTKSDDDPETIVLVLTTSFKQFMLSKLFMKP